MIINDKDAISRLNSPLNLINRLKDTSSRKNAMSLFIPSSPLRGKTEDVKTIEPIKSNFNPFQPQPTPSQTSPSTIPKQPVLEQILENHESQIKLGLAHDSALALLSDSVKLLATKLDDIKADKLPSVVTAASKVVESIRKERNEATKNNKDREVHYHFYTPQQNKVSDYEIIDVGTTAEEEREKRGEASA